MMLNKLLICWAVAILCLIDIVDLYIYISDTKNPHFSKHFLITFKSQVLSIGKKEISAS